MVSRVLARYTLSPFNQQHMCARKGLMRDNPTDFEFQQLVFCPLDLAALLTRPTPFLLLNGGDGGMAMSPQFESPGYVRRITMEGKCTGNYYGSLGLMRRRSFSMRAYTYTDFFQPSARRHTPHYCICVRKGGRYLSSSLLLCALRGRNSQKSDSLAHVLNFHLPRIGQSVGFCRALWV